MHGVCFSQSLLPHYSGMHSPLPLTLICWLGSTDTHSCGSGALYVATAGSAEQSVSAGSSVSLKKQTYICVYSLYVYVCIYIYIHIYMYRGTVRMLVRTADSAPDSE